MLIKEMEVDKLIPYTRNPRKNRGAVAKVAASIKEYGFRQPIVVDPEMVVVAGHTRLAAAWQLNLGKVPVHVAENLSEAQIQAYRIMDNRSHEDAEWDDELLGVELADLSDQDFDLDLTGFTASEIEQLLNDKSLSGELDGEDDVPEAPAEPKSKRGEIYQLGEHRLMCGDSTSEKDVKDLMQSELAAFCFTSPPYLEMRDYGGCDTSLDKLKKFISVGSEFCDFFAVNLGIARKDGALVRYWDEYIAEAESVGLFLTSWNIWSKKDMGGSVANMSAMFPIEHEWIFIFGGNKERVNRTKKNKSAGLHTHILNRQKDGKTKKVEPKIVKDFGRMGSVYESCYDANNNPHPAAFPVSLPESYVEACSKIKDVIYEPFGGSGSTLIACEKLNRKCYMMEIDPNYCDVIIERYEKKAEKING
jgi:DNA modification methylase